MVTEVSSLLRIMGSGYKSQHRTMGNESKTEKSTAPITRDFLGGSSSSIPTKELDLDMQVPIGWEKCLDLKTGKVSIQRCNSSGLSPFVSENKLNKNEAFPKLYNNRNFLQSSSHEPNLELKLFSSSMQSTNYQNVCTLDKVKSALERAEKEPKRKRPIHHWLKSSSSSFSSQSASYSSSPSLIREIQDEESDDKVSCSSPMAVGCPGCFSYFFITKDNPKCPKCNSTVSLPLMKKPKIDLNISI